MMKNGTLTLIFSLHAVFARNLRALILLKYHPLAAAVWWALAGRSNPPIGRLLPGTPPARLGAATGVVAYHMAPTNSTRWHTYPLMLNRRSGSCLCANLTSAAA